MHSCWDMWYVLDRNPSRLDQIGYLGIDQTPPVKLYGSACQASSYFGMYAI